ncbi:MAG: hypothetical protein KY439_00870 [Actinobacteria bacterium]|nr:hypothetical protein [Actinomycetota bacterium]
MAGGVLGRAVRDAGVGLVGASVEMMVAVGDAGVGLARGVVRLAAGVVGPGN